MSKQEKGTELDKLKRRMIRTVARLLKEKKSEEEVWKELQKESGTNCKTLWERMRSLTLKKLKRLLDADDRVEYVPAVARMTLTDWLLYDLVIVHEKIDVIDRQNQNKDSKVLTNLFSLVQRFMIEGRSGDDLAEAWTAATVCYNSKGHQCSPMLMQRRWYQLKELTRSKLYKFWFSYRGNDRFLEVAMQDQPTELQRAVALRYPDIITKPFPEWEERIEQKLVVMPEEFEVKMRKKTLMKPSDENVPDVVIVERKIDTITLGDSDSDYYDEENSRESNATSQNAKDETSQTPVIVNVKTEPQDDYESINTTDHSLYQPEEPKDRFQEEIERLTLEEDKILTDTLDPTEIKTSQVGIRSEDEECTMPVITNVMGAVDTITEDNTQNDVLIDNDEFEIVDGHSNEDSNTEKKDTIKNDIQTQGQTLDSKESDFLVNSFDTQSQESIVIDDDDDEMIPVEDMGQEENDGQRKNDGKDFVSLENDNYLPFERKKIDIDEPAESDLFCSTRTTIVDDSHVKVETEIDLMNVNEQEDKNVNENQIVESTSRENTMDMEPDTESHNIDCTDDIISEMSFADEGIEFADDGIEFNEEDQYELSESPVVRGCTNIANENEETPKFDLKLLMNPVVYTTKLDEMTIYKDRSVFDTIHEKDLVDMIILESKPISTKSINVVEQVVEQDNEEDGNINKADDVVQVKIENQDANEVDDDLFHNESSDEPEDDVIDESKKVKLSSSLLQKPRIRSYHPIQLCKNPDFNTRLKRLTVGFFSLSRNRAFLKACKPMTIDLSKTFESKLVDGTMYLKPSDQIIKKEVENITESTVSILPSAVAVQSLMDNETVDADKILQEELKKRILERNKTINLPNISVVRQINQHLLMAEVAPIMAHTEKSSTGHLMENIQQTEKTIEKQNEISFIRDTKRLKLDNTENLKVINSDKSPIDVGYSINPNELKKKSSDDTSNNVVVQSVNNDVQKSKVDKALEKQKKRHEKQKEMPSWLTKSNVEFKSDSLLTIDTLYKMLHALDPSSVQPIPVKTKQKKMGKKYGPIQNKSQHQSVNDNATNTETRKPEKRKTGTTKTKDTDAFVLKVDENKSKRQKYCCWAKVKINKMTGLFPNLRLLKHKCPTGTCKCCCKEILRQKEIDAEVKILESMQNKSDNLNDAIEQVVQQSRDLSNVSDPEIHIVSVEANSQTSTKISVGLQANLDEDTIVQVTNSESEVMVAEQEIEKEVTIDVDAGEVNVPPLIEIQSPKPKIRVYSGLHSYQNNSVVPPPQRKKRTRMQSITIPPSLETPPSPPTPPPPPPPPPIIARKIAPVTMPKYASELPCSCRPNVAVDKFAAMLVVDGSNACPRHTKTRVSRETRIYLNRKNMSNTERPFYVGKNKILLTNVKQPTVQSPEPVPITLPDGVQVVLLPDGTITYLISPGVELTPSQISAMPAILSSIQAQINASGITLPTVPVEEPVVVNSDDDAVSRPDGNTANVQNLENSYVEEEQNKRNREVHYIASSNSTQINKDYSLTTSRVDQSDSRDEGNKKSSSNVTDSIPEVTKHTNDEEENKLFTNATLVSKNSAPIDAIDTKNIATPPATETENVGDRVVAGNEHNGQGSEKNAAANSSRNLLSDLMEMSGILDEDIVPVQQHLQEHSIITPPEPIKHPITSQDPDSLLQPDLMPVPDLSSYKKNKHTITAHINDNVYELNPITSFAELKYACDNDGLFFKLDLTNGLVVPINVCIQKTTPESNNKINIGPTEVIDLTDEQGNSINETNFKVSSPTTSDNTRCSKIVPRKLSSMLPVVPSPDKKSDSKTSPHSLLIFDNDTTNSSNEQKKQALLKRLSNNLKPLKILEKRRNINILKKNLPLRDSSALPKRHVSSNKIEARIDLVDSDAPMEEEYLVEDSSEDSDDEPLAKIAKKKRALDARGKLESERDSQNSQDSQDGTISQDVITMPVDQSIDFEEAIDATEPSASSGPNNTDIIEPVPTQLVLTGGAINQPIPLNDSFQVSNDADDEDSQDDCILGV